MSLITLGFIYMTSFAISSNFLVFRDRFFNLTGHQLTLTDPILLEIFTHPSSMNATATYERFEFLGDSIINAMTTYLLFEKFPHSCEGELSRLRAVLVSAETLGFLGEFLGLQDFILFGKGALHFNLKEEAEKKKIWARVFEALVGALFFTHGFDQTLSIVKKIISSWEEKKQQKFLNFEKLLLVDVKSRAQELSHVLYKKNPVYKTLRAYMENNKDFFEIALLVNDIEYARTIATSKKNAEKKLAQIFLEQHQNYITYNQGSTYVDDGSTSAQ